MKYGMQKNSPQQNSWRLELSIARLPAAERARNVVLVDRSLVEKFAIEPGAIAMLETARGRRLPARVLPSSGPSAPGAAGLDRYQLQVLKPRAGEKVSITPVRLEIATRLVLETLTPLEGNLAVLEQDLARRLSEEREVACKGMLLPVRLADPPRNILFRIITVNPEYATAGEGTRLMIQTGRLLPGVAANLVTFEDVGGLQEQIDQIREMVEWPLRFPDVFETLGVEPPRGVLLYGPPGAGKTHLAKAIANEIGARFFYVNGPEIISSLRGGTEENLRKVFAEAMEHAPAIVLIDELDAIAPRRGESGLQSDVRSGAQLLALLDGLISMDDVVVIGTTNRVNSLDPALRRPGRFDREIFIPPPTAQGRLDILRIHTRAVPLDGEASGYLPDLAQQTHGYVGADLRELVREAAFNALRRSAGPGFACLEEGRADVWETTVTKSDFIAALQRTRPSGIREAFLGVPDVGWEDIGGLKRVIESLREAVELPLTHGGILEKLRVRRGNGILLYGPPGTGKTLLAKAIASQCGINFISINGADIFSKWFGQSEEAVRQTFQIARQVAPAVVFLDQAEALAPRRSSDNAHEATGRVVSQLLAEMDGIRADSQVIVVAATNRKDLLDPALLRPGRLGVQLYVGLPDAKDRRQIIEVHLRGLQAESERQGNLWIGKLARLTRGFSGADLAALCDRAKILALRGVNSTGEVFLKSSHFKEALRDIAAQRKRRDG
jgi:transitional endoplasmic reticulum ATPase